MSAAGDLTPVMLDPNPVKDGWFSESEVLWPGQKFSLKVHSEGVLYHKRSKFQEILVFKSENYGTVLVLDGVIQLTERDEFAYQEMIVHLPLFAHPNPKRVLIVGGGDGGVLREAVRHPEVERIDMCEIDADVVSVSKQFFSETMATAFTDPRLTLIHDDAAVFLREPSRVGAYDVIIVDSSDPVGPAESLFQPAFYESMRAALAPGGIVCTQGECIWLHLPLISSVITACGAIFPTVEYAYTTIPTYPSGQIGFVICSLDNREGAARLPARLPAPAMDAALKYYTPQLHSAAFVLPAFAQKALDEARAKGGLPPRKVVRVPRVGGCSISLAPGEGG